MCLFLDDKRRFQTNDPTTLRRAHGWWFEVYGLHDMLQLKRKCPTALRGQTFDDQIFMSFLSSTIYELPTFIPTFPTVYSFALFIHYRLAQVHSLKSIEKFCWLRNRANRKIEGQLYEPYRLTTQRKQAPEITDFYEQSISI